MNTISLITRCTLFRYAILTYTIPIVLYHNHFLICFPCSPSLYSAVSRIAISGICYHTSPCSPEASRSLPVSVPIYSAHSLCQLRSTFRCTSGTSLRSTRSCSCTYDTPLLLCVTWYAALSELPSNHPVLTLLKNYGVFLSLSSRAFPMCVYICFSRTFPVLLSPF